MKKMFLSIISAALCLSCNAEKLPGTDPVETKSEIHSVSQLIPDSMPLNSHADEEQWSVLQPMYGTYTVLPHKYLLGDVIEMADQNFANYPRIKKMAGGNFIMFYHGGQYGSRIWCTTSSDLKIWSQPRLLYSPETIYINSEADVRRFVNMDALVMPDGEILAVCSYRAAGHYGEGTGGGLMLIRSTDNGQKWTSPKIIYEGSNWEPYLLLLPNGKIHCYFTDATPQTRNSGTSLIVSEDAGKTWSTKIRVSRQYKYLYDGPNTEFTGEKIYTDQMPCFRVLNDGKTIAGFLEARLETPLSISGTSYCKMSVVYNDGLEWKSLGENSEGPERRFTNVFKGGSGYVVTFPSGEVVFSYNDDSIFRMKVLDRFANGYGGTPWSEGWIKPFPGKGFWGSMEVDSPQTLVAAMHCDTGMQIERFYMNRRIDAPVRNVSVDGGTGDWSAEYGTLYLSTTSGTETVFRASHDKDNLYILAETLLPAGSSETLPTLYLRLSDTGALKIAAFRVTPQGDVTSTTGKIASATAPASTSDGRNGRIVEFAVPLSSIGVSSGDYACFCAESITDTATVTFSLADVSVPSTWQRIKLE